VFFAWPLFPLLFVRSICRGARPCAVVGGYLSEGLSPADVGVVCPVEMRAEHREGVTPFSCASFYFATARFQPTVTSAASRMVSLGSFFFPPPSHTTRHSGQNRFTGHKVRLFDCTRDCRGSFRRFRAAFWTAPYVQSAGIPLCRPRLYNTICIAPPFVPVAFAGHSRRLFCWCEFGVLRFSPLSLPDALVFDQLLSTRTGYTRLLSIIEKLLPPSWAFRGQRTALQTSRSTSLPPDL